MAEAALDAAPLLFELGTEELPPVALKRLSQALTDEFVAGLDLPTFARFAGLAGKVPRIAVNNGYCFAGNAALFGSADLRLATRTSWIGMAGPAMIEGGGLGRFEATEIGQHATDRAKERLGQGVQALPNRTHEVAVRIDDVEGDQP